MGVWRKGFKDVMQQTTKWKILRGDKVMLTAGKDAGQVGTVLKVIRDPKFPRVVVEGLNLVSTLAGRRACPCCCRRAVHSGAAAAIALLCAPA